VAKILVADDNSNIQKMVGLALKDHGIEVVAVGNGEAAVRKIADIHPDLVLADVFMPVRNGYEVCKFVKVDKALAHIPVILLVGAFDPLDEQEAQRSGADGVLKKPFVPPDPLISMVKSALVRAGVPHAGFNPKGAEPEPAPAPDVAPPPRPPLPTMPEPKPFEVEAETESFVDEVPPRPAALNIESGQQPVAFEGLLETPAVQDEEPPEVSTAPVTLERDWGSSKEQEEEGDEEEDRGTGSWRRDAGDESFVESEAGPSSRDVRSHRHEPWTPTREKQDLTAAAESQEGVTAAIAEISHGQPAAPFAGEAWAAAMDSGSEVKAAVAEAEKTIAPPAELETSVEHASEPGGVQEAPAPEPASAHDSSPAEVVAEILPAEGPTKTPSSWFSTPPNPWEAEAQRASQLASTWDTQAVAPGGIAQMRGDIALDAIDIPSVPVEIEVVSTGNLSTDLPPAAVETVREEAAQAVEQAEQAAEQAGEPAASSEAPHDPAAHLDMDALVAKVLGRLSPGLLNDVTREILKPVVEAVIREELNSKKQ
jgi:CheY-like chemotaxis protein